MANRENLQIAQDAFEAFGRGDVPALLKMMTDDVEWNFPPTRVGIPWAVRQWRGRQAVGEAFKVMVEALDIQVFQPDEFIVAQDSVVVLGHERAVVRANGNVFRGNWAMVLDFRDGLISRYREYHDTSSLDAALSASEQR